MSVSSVFYNNDQQFATVNLTLVDAENKGKVLRETSKMAGVELAKTAANVAALALVALASAALAFVTYKLAFFLIGLVTLPLAILPPVHALIATCASLVVGGSVLAIVTKKYGNTYFTQMKEHFAYSKHLLNQANEVRKLDVKN